MFELLLNHRQLTDLVVTVKSAKEPNTRKELAIDMQGLAFGSHSPYLATRSKVTSSPSQHL